MELFLLYGARSALQANGTNNRLLGVNVSVSMAGCTWWHIKVNLLIGRRLLKFPGNIWWTAWRQESVLLLGVLTPKSKPWNRRLPSRVLWGIRLRKSWLLGSVAKVSTNKHLPSTFSIDLFCFFKSVFLFRCCSFGCRFHDMVIPAGGVEKFLNKTMNTEALLVVVGFAMISWVDALILRWMYSDNLLLYMYLHWLLGEAFEVGTVDGCNVPSRTRDLSLQTGCSFL